MDLKMEVYSPSLDLLGVLETFSSVVFEDKAFSTGSFSVDALITDETKKLLVPENIIWIEGDTAGIIEYIQEQSGKSGPYISVKGCLLTGILGRRILWGLYNLSGTPPAIMHELVEDCCINPTRGDTEARKIPGLVSLTPASGGDAIRVQKTGGTLLEELEELGSAYGVAFGVRLNPAGPWMEFWTRWGQDRSINQDVNDPVFYSTELDDVLSSEYSYNAQDYRNVALVAGEGEGKDRVMVTVNGDIDLAPELPTPPVPAKYTITLSVDPEGGGMASGGGTVSEGQSVTVTATAAEGYNFTGWQENGQTVSEEETYAFIVTGDRELTAVFAVKSRLPEGYTEVEYIYGSTTSGINTKIYPYFNKTRIVAKFELMNYTSNTEFVFSSNYVENKLFSFYRISNGTISYRFGKADVTTKNIDVSNKIIDVDINLLTELLRIGNDNFSITTNGASGKGTNPIYIGKSSGSGKSTQIKIFSFSIYEENDLLLLQFIPCINSDNKVGMYDTVSRTFFGASYGSYTPGPTI